MNPNVRKQLLKTFVSKCERQSEAIKIESCIWNKKDDNKDSDRMTTRASEITECKMWNNFQRKVKTGTHKRRQVIGNCEFTK